MSFRSEDNGIAVEANDDYKITVTGLDGRTLTVKEARAFFSQLGTAITQAADAKRKGAEPSGDSIPMVDYVTECPP